ncbi:MAG: hypothetical protein ACRDF4_08740 [Rhabdochlamydiaceae bacterium]
MRLGLRSFNHHSSTRLAASLMGPLPTIPATCNYHRYITLPRSALGNDTLGDCVEAGELTMLQLRLASALGSDWVPTDGDGVALYEKQSDYIPGVVSSDNGTDLNVAQLFLAQVGINCANLQAPDVAVPFALDPANMDHLRAAIYFFGGVAFCLELPQSAIDNQAIWDYVPNSPCVGGHFVCSGRYDAWSPTPFTLISWGMEIPTTREFLEQYLKSAFLVVSHVSWIGASGRSPPGMDWNQLEQAAKEFANGA